MLENKMCLNREIETRRRNSLAMNGSQMKKISNKRANQKQEWNSSGASKQ